MEIFHYTDRPGYAGISSQPDWKFEARLPPAAHRPKGAYFTNLAPTPQQLSTLCARIRIPRSKLSFGFCFAGTDGLVQLNHGRGRDRYIYFSKSDYIVTKLSGRQRAAGTIAELQRPTT